jgi:hypothetical protein
MSKPLDKKLYDKIKKKANHKFDSKTGIYRSSWIVREYKRLGGKYSGKRRSSSGLTRWFKEKWVDLNRPIKNKNGKVIGYKSCGRSSVKRSKEKYPLCRPSKRVSSKTPKTYKQLNKTSINKAKKQKSIVRGSKNIKFGGGEPNEYECKSCNYIAKNEIDIHRHNLQDHIGIDMDKASKLFDKTFSGREYKWLFEDDNKENNKKRKCTGDCEQKGGCGGLVCLAPLLLLGGGKSQYYGKRSSVMVKIPESVKKVALYSYKLAKLGFKGGVETGWKRAHQLSTRESISIEDLKYMRAWFARHIITSYPTYKKWFNNGRPKSKEWHNKRGVVAWLIWGGDAAFKWVNSKKNINLLNKHFGKNYKPMKLK